jgi:DNA-binding beta-propeller fold protein YncE
VVAAIPVGTDPSRVIAANGQVLVLDPADRTLARIDPQTNTVAQTIAIDSQPSDVLPSAGSLWVATRGGTVLRIDPGTGRIENRVRTGGDPSGLAATGGAIWVAADESGTIERINPQTGP